MSVLHGRPIWYSGKPPTARERALRAEEHDQPEETGVEGSDPVAGTVQRRKVRRGGRIVEIDTGPARETR